MLKVLAANRGDASSYYRLYCPFMLLKIRGLDVDLGYRESPLKDYDVLWMQMHTSAEDVLMAQKFKEGGGVLVYDVDDWLFDLPPSWACYGDYFERETGKPASRLVFHEMLIQLADIITTTTPYLAEKIKERFPMAEVRVLPNFILAADWDLLEKTTHEVDGPVLGWFGTLNHWDDWVEVAPAVDRALAKVDGHLAIMGAPGVTACFPKRLANRTFVHPLVPIDKFESVRLLLGACDVGFAWATHKLQISLCRSPLKALQWGAAGLPTVASKAVYGGLAPEGIKTTNLNTLETTLTDTLLEAANRGTDNLITDWQKCVLCEYSYETQAHRWAKVLAEFG